PDSGEIILPKQLAVNGCHVSVAGDEQSLCNMCAGIMELDLTDNRLKNWSEVFNLLHCMPRVHFLNLCNNPLLADSLDDITNLPSFPLLTKLILNSTLLTWEAIFKLLGLLPNLGELHLSLIELNELRPLESDFRFPSVKELYINRIGIDNSEKTLCVLGRIFPCLENLVMLNNAVTSLASTQKEIRESFPCLKSLNISETELQEWSEVEKIKFFPVLSSVRLQGIQFLQEIDEKLRRQLLIAYLPNVQRLNASLINETERNDAERACIRYYMDRPEKPPRYYELEEIHGRLDPLVTVDFTAQSSVTVMVKYEDRSFLKALDVHMTMKQARNLLTKELGLRPKDFTLLHNDILCPQGPDRMSYPDRHLRRYGVIDGSEIYIVPK
ncbi:hypothetical protein CAPTEDRAFT_44184, partial [Capitella teleta]